MAERLKSMRTKMKRPLRPASIFLWLAAIAWAISCIYPFVWMVYSSFKTEAEFARNTFSLPRVVDFGNFVQVIGKTDLLRLYFNSFINTAVSIPILLFTTFLIGYAFARYEFKGKGILRMFLVFGLLIPIHGLLVPLFIQFSALGMLNKRLTLILPYVATGIPVSVFLIEGYVRTIPYEIEEAAIIDSCNLFEPPRDCRRAV